MAENQIRVLSFNCWSVSPSKLPHSINIILRGLKYVSKNRKERIDGIAHELANSNHDIVALQEIWVFADYENVQKRVSKQLPHSKFFYRYCNSDTSPSAATEEQHGMTVVLWEQALLYSRDFP